MGLLRRAEPDGYEEFVAGRYREIVRFGALLAGDTRLGEDLAQEGLIAAYRSWHRLDVPQGRPEAYVRQVMVRTAMRARRRRWRGEVRPGSCRTGPGGTSRISRISVCWCWPVCAGSPPTSRRSRPGAAGSGSRPGWASQGQPKGR
ncbi:sigma factor [Micromonospora siamensis]|uniref:sigma factor n=1 Tax=Micromonospora siamensis TaxID=299152 RepID=UPI000B5AE8CF